MYSQGISRAMFPLRAPGKDPSLPLPAFDVVGTPGYPLVCSCNTPISASVVTYPSPCVPLPSHGFLYIILFIYFWLCWVFPAVHRLSLVAASGGFSWLWCVGFSLRWLLLLRSTGSRCAGFSSCGARAQ